MLEDKIKEYFIRIWGIEYERQAEDIAEICEVEYSKRFISIDDFAKELGMRNLTKEEQKHFDDAVSKNIETKIYDLDKYEQLEKENAELKAKCNLCYEALTEKSNKAITELMVDNTKVSEENRILKVKAVARNGRIMDLEQCYENMEDQRDELRKQIADIKYLDLETVQRAINANLHTHAYMAKAICSLAKPNKDKIIKILWKYLCTLSYLSDEKIMEIINRIANEICKED